MMMCTMASGGEGKWAPNPLLRLARRIQQLWYLRPVRTQVLIALLAVAFLASLIAGFFALLEASSRASVEMRAALELAEGFVRETTRSVSNDADARELSETLPSQLKHLRHVRIEIIGEGGQTLPLPAGAAAEHETEAAADQSAVPEWFVGLVRPTIETREVPVLVEGRRSAVIVIQGEPADEITEVWNDFKTMIPLWLATVLLMLSALYLVLGRILDPLVGLAEAMKSLEHGKFTVRFPPPKVRELRLIADRFNHLAAALDSANAENSRLCRNLITVQEEERREIAGELHDEVGPCLFGIMVNAASLERYTEELPREKAVEVSSRIGEIRTICDRLKLINRQLIKNLRPAALGRITIKELVTKLASEFEDRHPDVSFLTLATDLQESYGELVDLTVYRCIQEGITNALRHGNPSSIIVELTQEHGFGPHGVTAATLKLVIRDDGEGIDEEAPIGFGLGTMRERVRTLGGSFSLARNWPSGTAIYITIPLGASSDAAKKSGELFGKLA